MQLAGHFGKYYESYIKTCQGVWYSLDDIIMFWGLIIAKGYGF